MFIYKTTVLRQHFGKNYHEMKNSKMKSYLFKDKNALVARKKAFQKAEDFIEIFKQSTEIGSMVFHTPAQASVLNYRNVNDFAIWVELLYKGRNIPVLCCDDLQELFGNLEMELEIYEKHGQDTGKVRTYVSEENLFCNCIFHPLIEQEILIHYENEVAVEGHK